MSVTTIPPESSGLSMRTLTNSNFTDVDSRIATSAAARAPKIVAYPEDFGAAGDGVADDTVAIQAAITSLLTIHGIVQLSAKTYKVSSPLVMTSYVSLHGVGRFATTLMSTSTTTDIIRIVGTEANCFAAGAITGVEIRDMQMARIGQASAGDGVHIENSCLVVVQNVVSYDSKNAFYLSGAGATRLTSLIAMWRTTNSVAKTAIFLDSSVAANNSTIIDGHCATLDSGTNSTGILISGPCPADVFIDGFETAKIGISIDINSSVSGSSTLNNCNSDIHMTKLVLDQIQTQGIRIQNVAGGGVPCVQISDSHFQGAGGASGIFISSSSGVIAHGCQFQMRGNGACGVFSSDASNCTINGNVFEVNDYGVYMSGACNLNTVANNIFNATTDNPTKTFLLFTGSGGRNIAIGNTMGGFATTGILLDTGTSHNIAYPNTIDPANVSTPISNLGSNNVVS